MYNNYVELLAPAGNVESFYGSINAGADAVYLAGNRFGARAYAENFTNDDLIKCLNYSHILGKKVYLTVNTLIKENEIDDLYEYILPLYESGLDAVIVQDIGVFQYLHQFFPSLELHASTQMTLCSLYGAQVLKDMGASRIVPARELSLKEIEYIKNRVDIEIEAFVHGSMCYCYSGQCLFSSILGGRSGNRGRCAQPCRLPYSVKADQKRHKEGFYLSLKDMCTIEHIPLLIQSGIDSFKIEGRMKKAEYAAGVTSIYRRNIDFYYDLCAKYGGEEAAERYRVDRDDLTKLDSLYIRCDIHDGYYFKHNGKEMITLNSPAYRGSDPDVLSSVQTNFLSDIKRLPISMCASFVENEYAKLKIKYKNIQAEVTGCVVETAQKQPITEENIKKQLCKLGDTAFSIDELHVKVGENAFYSLKAINELRREGLSRLSQKIVQANGYHTSYDSIIPETPGINSCSEMKNEAAEWSVSLEQLHQFYILSEWMKEHSNQGIKTIYLSADLFLEHINQLEPICRELAEKTALFLTLPYIVRMSDLKYLEEIRELVNSRTYLSGFLVRSMDSLGYVVEEAPDCLLHLDANMYTWNRFSAKTYLQYAQNLCLPYELNAREQKKLADVVERRRLTKIVYGRIPMMITANCVLQTAEGCYPAFEKDISLIDRKGIPFPVYRNCKHCTNIIYNSIPYSLHATADKWQKDAILRIDFTLENEQETKQVLDAFFFKRPLTLTEYTTGHEKRGVE